MIFSQAIPNNKHIFQVHKDKPFSVKVGDEEHSVDYNSGESRSDMFGGNSNWRGPVWFPSRFQ